MHIPSHVLAPEIAVATAALTVPFLVRAAADAAREKEKLPQLAAASLLLLGLQSLDVTVPGGTTAHVLGAALLGILFGPWLASLGMAGIFAVQAVFLGDGGLDALGANVLNGGVVGAFLGSALFRRLAAEASSVRRAFAAFLAASASLAAGSLLVAVELGLSGSAPIGTTFAAMAGGHLAWAVFEGAATAALAAIALSPSFRRAFLAAPR